MTTITESFNTADSTTLGPDLTWVEDVGNPTIVSNRARGAASTSLARATTLLTGNDVYAETVGYVGSHAGGSMGHGPVARKSASATLTYYFFWLVSTTGSPNVTMYKSVGGTLTALGTAGVSVTWTTGDTLRIEASGTTIRGLINGTEVISRTDSAIDGTSVGGKAAGVRWYDGDASILVSESDSFGAGDLGSGATTHATTGAMVGAGATIAGTAAHIAKHGTTGALAGSGASVAGSAARTRAHPSSGALAGAGGSVAGTSRHNAPHPTSGALTGGGAAIAGAADHSVPGAAHGTSGALQGGGASVAGTAAHIAKHGTTGALAGGGAVITGDATRIGGVVSHATSGALVGGGGRISGVARGPGADAVQEVAYATPKRKREYHYDFSPAPVPSPIAQALTKAIEVKAEKAGVKREEIEQTLRRVADLGEAQEAVTRQIEAEAREIEQGRQAQMLADEMQRLLDAEDAQVAEILAMLL